MSIQVELRKNAYYDSVTLMQISKRVERLEGVERAMVGMGTDMNKELLTTAGLMNDAVRAATPNDLVIAFLSERGDLAAAVSAEVDAALSERKTSTGESEVPPSSVASAVKRYPDANLAVISLPGQYAAAEAMKCLKRGLHVMLFSDNVTVEEERTLKEYAHERGLLVMGPDCGTAILNGKGLCFANAVRRGPIGVVGASGTGTQEVTVVIDRLGGGLSQVIGTGGRDLSADIGGIMMCDGIRALEADPETEVILLVSKPPVKEVADKVLALAESCAKPVVVCFINSGLTASPESRLHFARTLEDAARQAVVLSGVKAPDTRRDLSHEERETLSAFRADRKDTQVYARGLFCGGTLCDEAMYLFRNELGDGKVYSNATKRPDERMADPMRSECHAFVDLGDDTFTVGKPHPMIDPSIRTARIVQEARDPETAVILLDVELGYGSHPDPAGVAAAGIREAKAAARAGGRTICFVAYVCGTQSDYQSYAAQVAALEAEGVVLAASNAQAAVLTANIIKGENV